MTDTFSICRNTDKESYGKNKYNSQTAQCKTSGSYKSKKVKGIFKHRLGLDFADDGLYIPVKEL